MSIKYKYLASIHGIEIETNDISLEVYDLKISANKKFIDDFFIPEAKRITGLSQYHNAINWKVFLFLEDSTDEKEFNGKNVLAYLLRVSKHFANALWMVKDNSARFQTGHFTKVEGFMLTVDTNFTNAFYSNCYGEKSIIKFNDEEIRLAKDFFILFFGLTKNDDENKKIESTHAEVNRIHRAYYFLDLARTHYDIGTKVSIYCSAFECLFSVATTELTHRLSETIANFIGATSVEKKDYYNKMKAIYELRSSVTHGSGIKKKLIVNDAKLLKEIGYNCDNILRKCILKICTTQNLFNLYVENKNEKFSEYFTNLIFD